MTNKELAAKVKDIALHYKTLYVNGCFGAPLTASNKQRYCNNNDYNRDPSRQKMIKAASADTFGFDCVCLITLRRREVRFERCAGYQCRCDDPEVYRHQHKLQQNRNRRSPVVSGAYRRVHR